MIRIYFHKDFDGVCSAAVFARYVHQTITHKPSKFIGVDYEIRKSWMERKLYRRSAIVDFLYHPDAEWWFDHHQTTFVRKDWELAFRPDGQHVWRTDYKSCPRLVIDSVADAVVRRKLAEQFSECLYWSDLIDSASYVSPEQVIECSEPALQVNATLSQDTSPEYLELLIKSLQKLPLSKVAAMKQVQIRFSECKRWQAKAIGYIKDSAQVDQHVAFIDFARHSRLFHRYAVYYLWPDVEYQVALYKVKGAHRLTVAANPWKEYRGPNLGALCERYGGGGHSVVAGIVVNSRKRALRIASEISSVLRGTRSFHQQLSFGHVLQGSPTTTTTQSSSVLPLAALRT